MNDRRRMPQDVPPNFVTIDAAYLGNRARGALKSFAAPLSGVYNAAAGLIQVAESHKSRGRSVSATPYYCVTQTDIINAAPTGLTGIGLFTIGSDV